jgi:hypothetical protein
MEQHAVPQDITGFKFKLVGNMTLKQFGELAGGAIVAYLFYASTWPDFLKWPLVLFFGFLGFALAFLPIEERPLDIWILNFFRAIYQPTFYVWKKGALMSPATDVPAVTTVSPIPTVLETPTTQPTPKTETWPYQQKDEKPVASKPTEPSAEDQKEAISSQNTIISIEDLQHLRDQKIAELDNANKKLETVSTKVKEDQYQAQKGPNIITVDDLARRRDDKKQQDEAQLRELLDQNLKLGSQIEAVKTRIQALEGADTSQLKSQLDNLSRQKDQLSNLIDTLQNTLAGAKPKGNETTTNDNQFQVRVVEKSAPRFANVTLTDVPNIINGIVSNETNMPLDNAILTIKDKAGNSIRALKSNQIGQFIASTPLENGTYYLEFERPGYTFDVLEITLNGKVIAPLEIYGHN